jgi:hypothetical protein
VTDDDGASNSITHEVIVAGPPPPPASTTTTITGHDPDPSDAGALITVSFTVTSASGTPDGNVQVTEANGESCSAPVAQGSCTLTPVGTGPRTITASYLGTSSFNSSSDTETHTVTEPPPAEGSLGLLKQPPSRTRSGERLDEDPEVQLLSSNNDEIRVRDVTVSVAVIPTGSLSGPTTQRTDDKGRAKFEDLAISGAEGSSVSLKFTAPGYADVDSQPITIRDEEEDDD